jgi:hypothetical protein
MAVAGTAPTETGPIVRRLLGPHRPSSAVLNIKRHNERNER